MKHLFVYGSLMFDEVWSRLVTRQYQRRPATLRGYKRLKIKHQVYPGIVKSPGNQVNGMLVLNLCQADIRRLDKFEGRYYRRKTQTVSVNAHKHYRAQVYVIKPRYRKLLSTDNWQADEFRNHDIQLFLSRYKNFNR
ncbi:MAG: gamma-glutamylcyclotransferase [Thioalkalispiraceae bacterium]|jgi:gamma-glutamylcyclotransferase (GGCT)/AIG2-like uncharacterized protein YtfP